MSNRLPMIINADGSPMKRAVVGGWRTSYQASDPISQDLAGWWPATNSADFDLLPERERITARIRDLVRNNGWASGIVSTEIDNVIGSDLRLSAKPDWRALGQDAEWAHDWGTQAEALWRGFANDPGLYCDAARHSTMGGLFGLAYRHYVVDGDATAAMMWLPGRGGAWSTAVRVIDPDRMSNPDNAPDMPYLRGGVELDDNTAAIAYHIRKRHPGDIGSALADAFIWERVPRETPWGRPAFIHHFDKERDGQTRGVGRLTPVLEKLKMLDKYDKVELQAAVLNAILAAFIESPFDHSLLQQILEDGNAGKMGDYQAARSEFHRDRRISLGGVQVPTLFPGEKIGMTTVARPNTAFAAFEAATLRNIAAGTGRSYEQIAKDWSQTNYSSARASLLEAWKTLTTRRGAFAKKFATSVYVAFIEEAIDTGRLTIPAGAPSFYESRAAYTNCLWIGPGRGWVDPVKEKQGAIIGMNGGMSTLELECAEQGRDYQEVLAQIDREIKQMPEGVLHPAQRDFTQLVIDQKPQKGEDPGE